MSFHDLLYTFMSSFVALFPVMNPIGNGFVVNGFLSGVNDEQRKAAIKKITVNCLLIGIGSLVVGHLVLLLFGLAVPVIQVGGGIIICKTGLEWLSESAESNEDKTNDAVNKANLQYIEGKLFYPISFPICLGPGSISVIFTMMASSTVKGSFLQTGVNYLMIALVILSVLGILNLFLSQGPRIVKRLGPSGNLIINKLVAFITFCVGIQIIVTGISKIFHLSVL